MVEPITPCPPESVPHTMMIQSWTTCAFLHWRVDPAFLRPVIPAELDIDRFDGSAWIGLVPFCMMMRLPYQPSIPVLFRYPETNVRTYVHNRRGRRGLWFLSLDVQRSIAVACARAGFGLPYAWSRMCIVERDAAIEYRASRLAPARGARSEVVVPRAVGEEEDSELAHFLTARFRLFGRGPLGPYMIAVEHDPWPIRTAPGLRVQDELVVLTGVPVTGPPDHVLVSPGGASTCDPGMPLGSTR